MKIKLLWVWVIDLFKWPSFSFFVKKRFELQKPALPPFSSRVVRLSCSVVRESFCYQLVGPGLAGTIATALATNSVTRTVTRRKLEAKLLGAAPACIHHHQPVSEAPQNQEPPRLPWPTCRRVTFDDSRDRDWKWFTDCHVELDEVDSDKPVVSKKLADGQK